MTDIPGEQLTMEEMLRQNISHPDFQNITQGGPSTQNPAGYNPVNVQDPTGYAQKFNEQFGGQPAPPAPPATGQEQLQPPLPQAPQQPQVPRDDQGRFTKLYAGKYRSPEDLENAYINQFQETQRIIAERDAQKAAMLMMNQQQTFRSREERQEPIKVNVPTEGEPFINPQQLDAYVEQRARQVASQQINETLGPILRSNQALNTIKASYPDYQQNESDFTKWLSINPEITAKIANDPDIGVEYAYLKFQRERGVTLAHHAQAQAAQAQPQLDQARQHAAPPNAARNETTDTAQRNKVAQELYEHGRTTGDWRPFQNFRLREAIPEWHTNTEWGKR